MESQHLIHFERSAEPWIIVNDDVMGGISQGRFEAKDGYGLFTGRLSLENNGGFASTRSPIGDYDLAGWRGLEFRVRADGRKYTFMAFRRSDRDELQTMVKEVQTEASDGEQRIRIPFEDMILSIRGRRFPSVQLRDPARVVRFGVLLADRDERRDFRLELLSVGKWK